jgi:hypothetical protein
MEPSLWLDVEAGHVPETAAQMRSMAGALKLSNAQLGIVVLLYRAPERPNSALPSPRNFQGTGGRYSNPHTLIFREGDETD